MPRVQDVPPADTARAPDLPQAVTGASQIPARLRAGLAGAGPTTVAGSDGIRSVARAGYRSAPEALPRYALSIPLYKCQY